MSGKTSREKRKMQVSVRNIVVKDEHQGKQNTVQMLTENSGRLKSWDTFLWAMSRKAAGEKVIFINPKTGELTDF